jgi:hypothetical protein
MNSYGAWAMGHSVKFDMYTHWLQESSITMDFFVVVTAGMVRSATPGTTYRTVYLKRQP